MIQQGTVDWATEDIPTVKKGSKVFVLPGAFYKDTVILMTIAGFERAMSVSEADVVVFLGGADVDPAFYQEEAMSCTRFNSAKDDKESAVYDECVNSGKIMFGICRGAQFLHVMNGGSLWQDANHHGGTKHWVVDVEEDVRFLSNSLHHQMIKADDKLSILGVCEDQVSTVFLSQDKVVNLNLPSEEGRIEIEVEAGYYPDTKSFFTQGHPEIGNDQYRSWTITKLKDFMNEWSK